MFSMAKISNTAGNAQFISQARATSSSAPNDSATAISRRINALVKRIGEIVQGCELVVCDPATSEELEQCVRELERQLRRHRPSEEAHTMFTPIEWSVIGKLVKRPLGPSHIRAEREALQFCEAFAMSLEEFHDEFGTENSRKMDFTGQLRGLQAAGASMEDIRHYCAPHCQQRLGPGGYTDRSKGRSWTTVDLKRGLASLKEAKATATAKEQAEQEAMVSVSAMRRLTCPGRIRRLTNPSSSLNSICEGGVLKILSENSKHL
jgi:hypothetical protein